jgi:UPF0755 protein
MSDFDWDGNDDGGSDEESGGGRALIVAVVAFLAILLVVVVVLAGPIKGLVSGGGDYTGQGSGSVTVTIHDGDSATTIGETLTKAGVVRSSSAFADAAGLNDRSRTIGPGTYRLRRHMSAANAVDLLLKPSSLISYRVTIPEGFTTAAIIDRLSSEAHISKASLEAAIANPRSIGIPAYAVSSNPSQALNQVEGFLFPATYEIQPGESATEVLKAMTARFDQAAQQVRLKAGAKKLHLTPYQVVTLASIVQREGLLVNDFPKIAEVFVNRYKMGMALGSDATEFYLLGPTTKQLTETDLQNPSPYNTRTNVGLPPTPINSPGEAALMAVLHHAKGPYLYFVTIDKAGHSAFATTLARFNELVAQSKANGVK